MPTQKEIAKVLNMSQASVSNLVADGLLPRNGTMLEVTRAYFSHLRIEKATEALTPIYGPDAAKIARAAEQENHRIARESHGDDWDKCECEWCALRA